MKATDIRGRICAVVAGIGLLLFVAFLSDSWSNASSFLLFTFFVATYSVGGVILGFIWPNSGWRLGLYLFSIWPLFLVASVLFSDPPAVVNWGGQLLALLGYLLILPGAVIGAWLGSRIRGRISLLTADYLRDRFAL
jgi:hypothetical protein